MLKKILLLLVVILWFIDISFANYSLIETHSNLVNDSRNRYINCYNKYCLTYGGGGYVSIYDIINNTSINSYSNTKSNWWLIIWYNNKLYAIIYSNYYGHWLKMYDLTTGMNQIWTMGKWESDVYKKMRMSLYDDSLYIRKYWDEQDWIVIYNSGNNVILTWYDVSNAINKYDLQSLDLSNIGVIDYNTNTKYLQLRTAWGIKVPWYKFYWWGLDKVSLFELFTWSYAFTDQFNVDNYFSNIYIDDFTWQNKVKQYFYVPDYEQLSGNSSDFGKSSYDWYIVEYWGQKYFMDKFVSNKTGTLLYNYLYFNIPNFYFYHCYELSWTTPVCDMYDISSDFTTDNVASDDDFNKNVNFWGNTSSSTISQWNIVIPSNLFDCSGLWWLDCVWKVVGDIWTLFRITITSPINNINNLINWLWNIKYNTCNTTGQNKIFTWTITTGQNDLLNKVFSQKINIIDYIMNFIIILFVIIWIYFIF